MDNKKIKVFVGVSGGVDSSVTLALLKKEGYDVTGVFLKVWNPDFLPCNWREERRSAMRVCSKLNVPFKTLDCEKEYKEKIVDYMIEEYKNGRTPNPDVFCNKYIKFGVFLNKAIENGVDFVATGHYAQKKEEGGLFYLLESKDKEKDQSYFLSNLNQKQLKHILFPIGHLEKKEVRKLAKEFNLETAEKKDSQGLCFIGKVDMKDFLRHYIEPKEGDVLDENENIIGKHNGAFFYTIGERYGSQIKNKNKNTKKLFIIKKDIHKNTITLAEKNNESFKENKVFSIEKENWITNEPKKGIVYDVCFRYHQKKQKCLLEKKQYGWQITTEKNQFDVASGQIAVIYNDNVCIGAGIIK